MKQIIIVDHFCGAGGESTGIMQAVDALGLKCELHAHNHWERAIETHSANHPAAIHRCARIENLDPAQGFPGEYWFSGNKTEQVRQIGNAVPVNTARELAMAALQDC